MCLSASKTFERSRHRILHEMHEKLLREKIEPDQLFSLDECFLADACSRVDTQGQFTNSVQKGKSS